MATTLSNTTFLFLGVLLIAAIVRYTKCGEDGAINWWRNVAEYVCRSRLILTILLLGGLAGVVSHVVVGYTVSGDLFQDYVGAREFWAGRSMNPPDMEDRARYWLQRENLESIQFAKWPPPRKLQAESIQHLRTGFPV